MTETYFNVSHDGKHVFRTDTYDDVQTINRMRDILIARFPATEGFDVSESWRSTAWNTLRGIRSRKNRTA
jgi:hypothetical protein